MAWVKDRTDIEGT